MSELDRITFFRSYYESIQELPDKVRLNVLEAILEYGLNGKEKPEWVDFEIKSLDEMKNIL